jgi:hypothetical protein
VVRVHIEKPYERQKSELLHVVADETGTDLVPVMRLRRAAVDAKTEELFSNLTCKADTRIGDYDDHPRDASPPTGPGLRPSPPRASRPAAPR